MNRKIFFVVLACLSTAAFAGVKIGDEAPDFKLKNTDGTFITLNDLVSNRGVMLYFTSNDCPQALAYEDRLIELVRKLAPLGWKVLAINGSTLADGPDESMEGMIKRAEDKTYEFPYLRDSLQAVARAYGNAYVPQAFLLKSTGTAFEINYIGSIDDTPDPAKKIHNKYVEWAVAATNAGTRPDTPMSRVTGCAVKKR